MEESGKVLALQVVEKYGSHLAEMAKNKPSDKPLALLEVGYGVLPSFSFKHTLEDTLEKEIPYTGIETQVPQNPSCDMSTVRDKKDTKNSKYKRGDLTLKIGQHGDVFDKEKNDISKYDVIIVRNIEPTIINQLIHELTSSARNGAVIVITAATDLEANALGYILTQKSTRIEFDRLVVSTENRFSYIHENYSDYQPDCNMFVIKVND
jgi:hypothetical protein